VKKIPLVRIGLFVAVLPIIAAFLFSLINGGSMFDEGSGGGGYLWFLMASLPLGFFIIVTGLIVNLVKRFKS
jgi:cytochrome bd-type quinol oxidase subunit 1